MTSFTVFEVVRGPGVRRKESPLSEAATAEDFMCDAPLLGMF
jgi:hypothetical protein